MNCTPRETLWGTPQRKPRCWPHFPRNRKWRTSCMTAVVCVCLSVCVWGGGVCEVREGRPLCYIPPCCSLTAKSSGLIFITPTRGLNSEVEGQAEFGRGEGRNTCVAMQGTLRSLLVLVCLNGVAAPKALVPGTWRARLYYRVDWCVRSDYKTWPTFTEWDELWGKVYIIMLLSKQEAYYV